MSTLLSRLKWSTLAGLMFRGRRDTYEVLGYDKVLSYDKFLAKYARQDIAKRVINAPVNATWKADIKVVDEDGDEGAFAKAFSDLDKQYSVLQYLARADRLCCLGEYSVLVYGLSGTEKVDLPATNKKTLLYLQPYGQGAAQIESLEQDPRNRRYGRPAFYNITPDVENVRQGKLPAFKVHHTRVLHICNAELEGEVYGEPVLHSVYNLFDDLLKVVGGSAEAFWMIANRGMQADVDKEMDLKEEDANDLSDEITEYQHDTRRFIRTRGVTIKPLGSESPSPQESFDIIVGLISGATGIPKRILLGSELGQLASEQDRANWAERIDERRTTYAGPRILIPFAKSMVNLGILPEPNGAIQVDWPEALQMTPLERAQTASYFGRALVNMSTEKQDIITADEARGLLGIEGNAPKRKQSSAEPAKRVRRVASEHKISSREGTEEHAE